MNKIKSLKLNPQAHLNLHSPTQGDGLVDLNLLRFSTTSSIFPAGIQLTDDGEGNIINGSDICGQIFYPHGTIVLIRNNTQTTGEEINSNVGLLGGTTLEFSSSLTIYEQQYKCTVLENEFGFSTNPSLLTSSIAGALNQSYYPFVTGSFFEPYITCVGLYNGAQELVAVGKLSFPLPVSQFTDTTVVVNFDIW